MPYEIYKSSKCTRKRRASGMPATAECVGVWPRVQPKWLPRSLNPEPQQQGRESTSQSAGPGFFEQNQRLDGATGSCVKGPADPVRSLVAFNWQVPEPAGSMALTRSSKLLQYVNYRKRVPIQLRRNSQTSWALLRSSSCVHGCRHASHIGG